MAHPRSTRQHPPSLALFGEEVLHGLAISDKHGGYLPPPL
jgi:hypothetical protein